jgi:hypothetical protein
MRFTGVSFLVSGVQLKLFTCTGAQACGNPEISLQIKANQEIGQVAVDGSL